MTNFGSEPSRFISQISGKPPRSVVYRICLPSGEKRGSASGSAALGELLRVLAAGVHAPDFHGAAAIADEDDRSLEAGQVDLARSRRRTRLRARASRTPLRRIRWRMSGVFGSVGDRRGLVAAIGLPRPPEAVAVGAEAGVGVDGKLLVAIGRPALVGGAVPGAAAEHAHLARRPDRAGPPSDFPRSRFRRTSRCTIARRCRACRTGPSGWAASGRPAAACPANAA